MRGRPAQYREWEDTVNSNLVDLVRAVEASTEAQTAMLARLERLDERLVVLGGALADLEERLAHLEAAVRNLAPEEAP